jgi:hypothetical protein
MKTVIGTPAPIPALAPVDNPAAATEEVELDVSCCVGELVLLEAEALDLVPLGPEEAVFEVTVVVPEEMAEPDVVVDKVVA